MVGINRDVTDLIDAERERVRANEAAQEAQTELAQVARLTTMGELAASIAHEISQPLAAVVSYGNGALRWLAQAPPIWRRRKRLSRALSRRAITQERCLCAFG